MNEARRLLQMCERLLLVNKCRSDTTCGKVFQAHRKHTRMILNCQLNVQGMNYCSATVA